MSSTQKLILNFFNFLICRKRLDINLQANPDCTTARTSQYYSTKTIVIVTWHHWRQSDLAGLTDNGRSLFSLEGWTAQADDFVSCFLLSHKLSLNSESDILTGHWRWRRVFWFLLPLLSLRIVTIERLCDSKEKKSLYNIPPAQQFQRERERDIWLADSIGSRTIIVGLKQCEQVNDVEGDAIRYTIYTSLFVIWSTGGLQ